MSSIKIVYGNRSLTMRTIMNFNIPWVNLTYFIPSFFSMGSSLSPRSQSSHPVICKLSKAYQEKIYDSNHKSLTVFLKEISGIRRKVGYLKFPWAEELLGWLSRTSADALYVQYSVVLLENSRRDGFGQKIFLAEKLKVAFLKAIELKYACRNAILSPQSLLKMIQQCKCYFMALGWLKKIATLDHAHDDDQSHHGLQFQTEEEVYSMIVQAASRTYVQYLQKEEISGILVEETLSDSKVVLQMQIQLLGSLRKLKKRPNFFERQKTILSIQILLKKNQDNLKENLTRINRLIGKSKIFAYIWVIKIFGNSDISFLEECFFGKDGLVFS